MKALWLSTLLLVGSSLVTAQGNSRTCDITLDRDLTVPRFCYNLVQTQLTNDSTRNLNFTLTNDSKLIFAALPENRQVEIEIDDNSDGLESWSNLANAFVDGVRSGSLPYSDVILPYLESAVDSPISSNSCYIPSGSTIYSNGDGDVDINELLNDFGEWWTPIIVVTVLGPVFAIIFIVIGICLCCCRKCGRCGGDLQQEQRDSNDKRCIVLYIIVICCICLLFVGVVFAFISNEKVNASIREMDDTVNTAVDNSLDFIEDTQREANITVDRYDEVNAFVQCEINNTHISIGGVVIEQFEGPVGQLINASLELSAELDESIDALQQVNETVVRLVNLTDRLQMELDNITAQIVALNMSCTNSTNPAITTAMNCDDIPTTLYVVVIDYTDVTDVSPVLAELRQQSGNIESDAIEANDTFYGIPCDIRDQITLETQVILDEADRFREEIANITADIEREISDILDEDGFVGDIRTQSSDTQEAVDEYDTPRYAIGIVLCSLTLVVIVILIVGLVLGGLGFRRKTDPQDRSAMSDWGGKILLLAVYSMFGFAVVLLLLASLAFFMGANMLKGCYSIAEDPPNDQPSYELFREIIDNRELWGGYLLGCFVLENSTINLTLTEMLDGCRDNRPLYQVARLAQRPGLNLENVTNISSQIPNLDSLFEDLEEQVQFDRDQILSNDTIDSLRDYTNAGLQNIDYTGYINQINSIISTLNVDVVTGQLRNTSAVFRRLNEPELADQTDMIIFTIERVNDTTIAEINNLTNTLDVQIEFLSNTTAGLNASVDAVIAGADNTFAALDNSSIVVNQSRAVLDRVIAYADNYANWAVDNLENQVGRCRPLYATYNNVYYDVCEDAVDGINGFWLALGWCVLFFIPTIVFAVWLSHYLRRMREWDSSVVPYDRDAGTDLRMTDMKS